MMMTLPPHDRPQTSSDPGTAAVARASEQGYLLIGLVVAIFLITLFLTVAAPTVAKQLERDREIESEHRAQQYVQAIHLYYLKFKTYPTSVDQLLSQSDIHFLRQQYKDPLTGGDYRLIHYGEAKTQVKGFFGEPLEGAPQGGGLGSLAGSASNLGGNTGSTNGTGGSGFGSGGPSGSPPGGGNSTFGNSFGSGSGGTGGLSFGGSSGNGSSPGAGTGTSSFGGPSAGGGTGAGSGPGVGGNTTNATGTLSGTNATSFQGSKGAIVGVGSNKSGPGILEWNGSAQIDQWEFLYDPRIDILKARVSLLGGTPGASGSGSFGTSGGNSSSSGTSSGGSGSFGVPGGGSSSFGSSTSGFGNGSNSGQTNPGSGFGSSNGSSNGNSGGFPTGNSAPPSISAPIQQ